MRGFSFPGEELWFLEEPSPGRSPGPIVPLTRYCQAWVINATELMRRKSSQMANVQPANMAKLAFNTFVIVVFMSLPLNCLFPVPAPGRGTHSPV